MDPSDARQARRSPADSTDPRRTAPPSLDATPPTGKADKRSEINGYDFNLSDEEIAAEKHRGRVGPDWDAIGRLQFNYLVEQGLSPSSYLLDVGCGALRGGIHFIPYLAPGHYYGIDSNASLLRAGWEHEIPKAGLEDRLPSRNLRESTQFACDFGVPFDFALAQSVFTHLPLNHIRICFSQVARVMPAGGRFFATFFFAPDDYPVDMPVRQSHVTSWPDGDPYHYRPSELKWAATSVAHWELARWGEWNHPRGQQMAEFRRLPDS